jgi:hypothetical protein
LRNRTYSALKDTETPLKNVHDRIIESLPVVDHIIIMDAGNDISRGIIFTKVAKSPVDLFRVIPSPLAAFQLLKL